MDDKPHRKPHEAVHLAHPLAVAPGQIIVDRHNMDALSGQRIEIRRQNGHQRLALAGLHLGNAPLMEHDAADQLYSEGLHAQHPPGRLPHGGESLRKNIVRILPLGKAGPELVGLGAQLRVRQFLERRIKGLYFIDNRIYPF